MSHRWLAIFFFTAVGLVGGKYTNVVVFKGPQGDYDYFLEATDEMMPQVPAGIQSAIVKTYLSDGVRPFYLAGPLTLHSESSTSSNIMKAKELRHSSDIFVQRLMTVRGGLQVDGQQTGFTTLWMDDSGEAENIANVTAFVSRVYDTKLLMGGFGSDLTTFSARQARYEDALMLSAGSSRTNIYEENRGTIFGLLPPGKWKAEAIFDAVKSLSQQVDDEYPNSDENPCGAPGCVQSLVLGLLGKCTSGDMTSGQNHFGAEKVLEPEAIADDTTQAELRESLQRLQGAGVTLLKVCKLNSATVKNITLVMEEMDFDVLGFIVDVTQVSEYSELVSGGWFQGGFMIDVAAWHETYPTRGTFSGLTSSEFSDIFRLATGYQPSVYAAAQFAAMCALGHVLETAPNTSVEALREGLRNIALEEFYGKITFDENGQSSQPYLVLQFRDAIGLEGDGIEIVHPREKATAPAIFPRPTWRQMRCRYETARLGEECFGQGTCDRKGKCACRGGWTGSACANQVSYIESDEGRFSLIVIVMAVLGVIMVASLIIVIILSLSRRREKRIRELLLTLHRAVGDDDHETVQQVNSQLYILGWSASSIEDTIKHVRRMHSERRGISVDYLLSDEFLHFAQERTGKEDPTFYDLKDAIFFGETPFGADLDCPRDGKKGVALVDALDKRHVGECTHFLSWTWGYKVSTVRAGLEHWLELTAGEHQAHEVFLFMCFFVNNQYRIIVNKEKTSARDLELVFEENLARIGKVVALLDTWDNPRYLTRIWTIFEQAISIKMQVPVTMVLPKEASLELLAEFEKGKEGIIRVRDSLTKVDSASAEAYSKEDEEAVKALIEPTGFKNIDLKIINFMSKWVGMEMEMHMRSLVNPDQAATKKPGLRLSEASQKRVHRFENTPSRLLKKKISVGGLWGSSSKLRKSTKSLEKGQDDGTQSCADVESLETRDCSLDLDVGDVEI